MSSGERASSHNRLRQLRAFCQTAQAGSISKAAERLFLSQPSVSLLIKGLEEDLGTQLFERRGPRIRLTPAGEALRETALPLVEAMDRLPELFAARLGEVDTGTLDIAAGESTILYLLGDYIKAFSERYPGIGLHLHNVTGRDGMALLRAGEVDLAVGSLIEIPDDISFDPVFTYEPMLITPLDHPLATKEDLTLEDIGPYGLILPPRHLSTWRVVDLVFQQHGVPYHVVVEAGGWEVVKRFVELGLGISIVTSVCLQGDEQLKARALSRYFPKRTYGIVTRRGQWLSAQARAFVELMDPEFFSRAADTNDNAGSKGRAEDARTDFTGYDEALPVRKRRGK